MHSHNLYRYRFLTALLLIITLFIFSVDANASVQQQAIHFSGRLTDTVSDNIKDSLKNEIINTKLNNPVKERQFLTEMLKEDKAAANTNHVKKRGERFYYHMAVAFTKLRLYSLAMKCYFKTLTVENREDTLNIAPVIMASVDSKQLLAANLAHHRDSLLMEDSLRNQILAVHNDDIAAVYKDTASFNGDKEIRSKRVSNADITDPFDDGKKAAAYALLIHVRQPVSGKRKVYVLNNVGHTFVTLIKYNTDSTIVSRSFGFYPKKNFVLAATPLFPSSPSTFKDDSKHSWDEVSGTFISRKKFNRILTIVRAYDHKKYQLSNNNCTDFGLAVANEAGITVTDTQGTWPLGKGNNPACMGQSILEGKISAANTAYSGKLLVVTDLVNTTKLTHYHK